jgi:hypothetical protein
MTAAALAIPELQPIEIDPRPCELCGLTIDRHVMVDDGEGPEFFCAEDDPPEWLAAGIMQQWELADIRDKWRHTGEPPPPAEVRNGPLQPAAPAQHYRTPQSVVDAFWFVTRLDDPEYLARWLADHQRDAAHLLKIWKARQC